MMETQSFSDDIRRYLMMAWHWSWLLVLASALAAGVAYLVSSQMSPVYQASTTVLIQEPSLRGTEYSALVTSERLAQTYAQLMVKMPVLERVVETLGLELSPGSIRGMIQVSPVRDTQLIEVRVQDVDPVRAALIANALVSEFAKQNQERQAVRYQASKQSLEAQVARMEAQIGQVTDQLVALGENGDEAEKVRLESLQAQYRQTFASLLASYESVRLAEAQSISSLVPVETALPPGGPIGPKVMQNTMLAAVVGLMLGLGVIFMIEALDDTLRSPEEVSRQLGLPVLGVIARTKMEDELPIAISQPRSPVTEAFRSLRTNIQFASVDTPIHTLMVTSSSPSDGKSTVAVNLAAVMAQGERSVAVIDADLRRPRLHKLMHVSNRRGVSDLFIQPQVYLDGSLQSTESSNLMVLTSGSLPPNPSELLGSEKMSEVIRQVRQRADLVILDTPPVLAVTDAVVLASRVDGVLIVARPGATKLAVLRQTVDQLQRVGAKILGVVLNDVDLKRTRYYYNYKGYYFTYYNHYNESGKPEKNGSKKNKTPEPV